LTVACPKTYGGVLQSRSGVECYADPHLKEDKGADLVMPACNTEAMILHLVEVALGAHAVLVLKQAGWHLSHHVVVPPNIILVARPPRCPEFNSVENLWQFMRDTWLSNRVFTSHEDLLDHCCAA